MMNQKLPLSLTCLILIILLITFTSHVCGQDNRINQSYENRDKSFNTSVNLSTGQLNLNIPLFTLESEGVSLPVSLAYSYLGYSSADVASWVGSGWNITGLPSVSRNLNGFPDDQAIQIAGLVGPNFEGGYLRNSRPLSGTQASEDIPYISSGKIDLLPDLFNYSMIGLGGTFALKRGIYLDNPEAIEFPFIGNRIESIITTPPQSTTQYSYISNFNIWDLNNVKYEFGEREKSEIDEGVDACNPVDFPEQYANPSYTGKFGSNWLVTKILNPFGLEAFSFSYSEENEIVYPMPAYLEKVHGYYHDCEDVYRHFKKYIETITYDNGHVDFILDDNERQDLSDHYPLKEINVYKDGLIEPIQRILFTYSYFNCPVVQQSLMLQSIEVYNSENELIQAVDFQYNNNQSFCDFSQNELVVSRDYWGYANGQRNNTNLLPIPDNDLEPSLDYVLYGSLIRVENRTTGAVNEFDFELNEFSRIGSEIVSSIDYPLLKRFGPGIRIKSNISSDGNGEKYKTTYKYSMPSNSLFPSSGILIDPLVHASEWNSTGDRTFYSLSSQSNFAATFAGEAKLMYTRVREYNEKYIEVSPEIGYWEPGFLEMGSKISWFQFEPNEQEYHQPYAPLFRPYWRRGVLVREAVLGNLDVNNGSFPFDTLVVKEYEYESELLNDEISGLKVTRLNISFPDPEDDDEWVHINQTIKRLFTWQTEKFRVKKVKTKKKVDSPYFPETVETMEYFYDNPNTNFPSKEVVTSNDGTKLTTNRKFFSDYDLLTSNWSDPEISAIGNWHNASYNFNPDFPVEVYTTIERPGDPVKLLNSMITIYEPLFGAYGVPIPKYTLKSRLDAPLENYTPSKIVISNTGYKDVLEYEDFFKIEHKNTEFSEIFSPIETENRYGENQAVILHPNDKWLIAQITNGSLYRARYTSFEENYHGGWNPQASNIVDASEAEYALTGEKYYNLGIVEGNDGDFNSGTGSNGLPGGKYLLSYWSKGNVITFLNNGGEEMESSSFTEDDWTYTEKIIGWNNSATDNFIRIDSEANQDAFIDELRLHEIDATMETWGYYPDGKIKYKSSSSGEVVTFEYDAKGRLEWLLNRKRNVIEHHQYQEKDILDVNSYNKHTVYSAKNDNRTKQNITTSGHTYVSKRTEFSDGFGRFRQAIDFGVHNSGTKRVSFAEYDSFGRTLKKYLPYYYWDNQSDADYITDAPADQLSYYSSLNDPNEENTAPYTVTRVENSPLQRPVEAGSVGQELQPGNGHSTHLEYGWNTASDSIRKWVFDAANASASANSIYADNKLRKETITDPDGRTVSTFTDALGRKIATSVLANVRLDNAGRTYTGNVQITGTSFEKKITSYTVFDDFNRVVFEIPAKAMEELEIAGSFNVKVSDYPHPTLQIVKELVSTYSYDQKGRLWQKEIPGAGKQNFVYDHFDRVVMSRDNQQIIDGVWNFVKYDTRGRIVLKGTSHFAGHYDFHQGESDEHLDGEVIKGETFLNNTTSGPLMGYTNTTYPVLTSGQQDSLTNVYYFDNYDFDISSDFSFIPFNGIAFPLAVTRGLPTGSLTRILKSDGSLGDWLTTVTYYDSKKRPIQAFTQNHKGGWDRVDTYYNELGQVEKTIQYHRYTATADEHIFTTGFTYYNQTGRLQSVKCKINDDDEIIVSARLYDEKGQLKKLKLHQAPGAQNYMQTINYRYNDQGQLTHINNTALIVDAFNTDDDDVFGQELTYFDQSPEYYSGTVSPESPHTITPQYSGNISSMMWNAKTPDEDGTMLPRHAYVYRYDDLNNLTEAKYGSDVPSNPGIFNVNLNYYNENQNYDLGGNIMRLKRNRDITPASFPAPTQMDNLTFTYYNNGYAPKAIDDSGEANFAPQRKHFIDNSGLAEQYLYDQSGRLTEDKNRKIKLSYNRLGLPANVKYAAGHYGIEYMYDGAGNKLQKYHHDTHTCPPNQPCPLPDAYATDYIGNFVYERGELKMIYHPEGVIRPTPPSADNETEFVYDYFIKDYLGNVRVVLTEENATYTEKFLTTLEEVHRTIEENNFDNLDETAEDLPTGYPVDGSVEFNEKIALLSAANGTEIGPSIVLPVRRGDKVSLRTDYFYTEDAPGTTYDNLTMLVNEVLLALAASGSNILRLTEGQLTAIATGSSDHNDMLSAFFSSSFDTTDIHKPHAYLVWMLYDNDMKLMPSGSGVRRVTDPNALEELIAEEIPIEAEGYLHAYVSNGSEAAVSFDNFLVTYIRGKTRQINHYYPYGLSIDALSRSDEYLNKYTGKELQTGEFNPNLSSGLEMYDFHARFYDPQLGRWFTPDPAEQFANPYLAMGNNPVVYVDPDGEFIWAIPLVIGAAMNVAGNWEHISNAGSFWEGVGVAAGYAGVGALQGAATLIGGPGGFALGGAIGGLGNGLMQGQSGSALFQSTVVGAAAGLFGGAAAQSATGALGSFASPLLTGVTHGAVGGVAGGAMGGFVAGGLMGGNPWEAAWSGAKSGLLYGSIAGGVSASATALSLRTNPITGKALMPKVNRIDMQPMEMRPYNASYDRELTLPKKLSHYTSSNSKPEWNSLGFAEQPNKLNFLTGDNNLTRISSPIDLSLNKQPNYRIDINTDMPTFDPSKVVLIRRVTGNVNYQGGGGWEVIYKGPLNFDKNYINVTIID